MTALTKRSTVYLEPSLYKVLRMKAVETSSSVSELINKAIQQSLKEDIEDLTAFEARADEPVISFEAMLKQLERDGKL